MSFSISNTLGPWTTDTFTLSLTTTPEFPNPPFAVGTVIAGSQGAEWLFCRLAPSQTIAAGDFVYVSSTDAGFLITSFANAARGTTLGAIVGVAGAAATSTASSANFIWIQRKGVYLNANVATSSTGFTQLRSSATGGRVTSTATASTSVQVNGVVALATAAANLANVMLNYPAIGAND